MLAAVAAILFVSTVAVYCISDDGSDAAFDPYAVPFGPEHGEMQGPAPAGEHQDRMQQEPPRYVIDAPDRPDNRPERIIDDYGRMFEEKRGLEENGAEVFICDPELERDAGKELAGILNEMFDDAILSERPQNAEVITQDQLPDSYDVSFLEFMQEKAGKDTWIGQLLSVMISQYVSSSNESEGVAASQERDDRYIEIPSDMIREESDEGDEESFIDDLPEFVTSSESFLIEHGFDGGTFF